jgi:Domain of unknown function (DUF4258)
MKRIIPESLLILYIILPLKTAVAAQIILCQIRSIHAARQAEKKLALDLDNNNDEAFREFLVSFWLNPDNIVTYAYLGLLAPHLGLLNNPVMEISHKVASDKFEISNHAVGQSIVYQIRVNEIKEAIANGEIIRDYHHGKHNSSYVMCGFTQAQRPIHVKCSYPMRPLIKIIAVYQPDPDRWCDNFTMRRNISNDE